MNQLSQKDLIQLSLIRRSSINGAISPFVARFNTFKYTWMLQRHERTPFEQMSEEAFIWEKLSNCFSIKCTFLTSRLGLSSNLEQRPKRKNHSSNTPSFLIAFGLVLSWTRIVHFSDYHKSLRWRNLGVKNAFSLIVGRHIWLIGTEWCYNPF